MLTRPFFLLVGRLVFSFSLVLCLMTTWVAEPGQARKKRRSAEKEGTHVIAKKPWPPAISPDFVLSLKRDKLLVANKYGRLSIVDFRKAGYKGTEPTVMGEISGIGKKLVSIDSESSKAYALVNKHVRGESQTCLLTEVETRHMEEPSVVSTKTVKELKEGKLLLADRGLLFIAGLSTNNENLILVVDSKKSNSSDKEPTVLSTITTKTPVVAMDFDRKNLIALSSDNENSQLSFINLSSKTSPQLYKNLELNGSYNILSRYRDVIVLGGVDKNGNPEARSVGLKPEPNIVAGVTLNQLEKISDLIVTRNEVLVAGNSKNGTKLLSLSVDKHANLLTATEITRNTVDKHRNTASNLVFDGKTLFLSSGWSGIETLKLEKREWRPQYHYTIPRMGASNMASWGASAVLAAGELIKYDLSDPESPKIDAKVLLSTPVKSMVGAGSYILCLSKDGLMLRKMDNIDKNVALEKVKGKSIAFDKEQHKAYVVQPFGKVTRLFPFKVYSDSLDAQSSMDIPGNFTRLKANGGRLLLSDLNDVAIYTAGAEVKKVGHRHFDNYAVRDAWLLDEYIVVTAIDQSSKGFLLVLSARDEELNILGNTPLPHDGTALSALGNKVVTIGRNEKGKDLLTVVDIKNPTQPVQKESRSVIEAASSVSLKSRVTLVAGRGLEILSVSAEN